MSDITTLLFRLRRDISANLRVSLPGKIVDYDYTSQKASVKLDMKELYSDDTEVDYPIITAVPVIFLISGGASITAPVKSGDSCLVIFNDRDITNWLLGAGGERPDSTRLHDLNDAVIIMGLQPFTNVSPAKNNDDLLISYDGSEVILRPNGNIDIINGSTVNIKTSIITINCDNSIINATEDVSIKCSSANISAENQVTVDCDNATIKAKSNATIESSNAIVKASNNASIECNDAFLTANEQVIVQCNEANVTANTSLVLKSNDIQLNSDNNTIITASSNITLNATESLTAICKNAVINASESISATTVTFSINGNVEITGTTKMSGAVTTENGIVNTGSPIVSNNISLDTHTHPYIDTIGEPPVPTPSTTSPPTP